MNVKQRYDEVTGLLIIEVDLTKPGTPSKSGKSLIVGTTNGFVDAPGNPEVSVSLNVIRRWKDHASTR
jgi:hypothetical protein